MKNGVKTLIITLSASFLAALAILFLRLDGRRQNNVEEARQGPLMVTPQIAPDGGDRSGERENLVRDDALNAKVPLLDGEVLIGVLTQDLNGDLQDEQIIASRAGTPDAPVRITYAAWDPARGGYRRFWSVETAAARPGAVSMYLDDLAGDRSQCLVVAGVNSAGEHTLSVFRREPGAAHTVPWRKIAGISIDGAITIRETVRGTAYRMGQAAGESYVIAAYGRDTGSDNLLDQTEILYQYSPAAGEYRETRRTRVPGSQTEQRRVRELLSGRSGEFEQFIAGLWYYVSPQGTLDSRRYIYFDPANREIIFYIADTQQVFSWQASSITRYGLYISSHNVPVTTLRRSVDIELESLSAIRIRTHEDVRLNIIVSDSWDGSYRKAGGRPASPAMPENSLAPWTEAVYEGAAGRLAFDAAGGYTLSGAETQRGIYAFFTLDNKTLLELQPGIRRGGDSPPARETWLVEYPEADTMTLTRAALTTRGIQTGHDAALTLTRKAD